MISRSTRRAWWRGPGSSAGTEGPPPGRRGPPSWQPQTPDVPSARWEGLLAPRRAEGRESTRAGSPSTQSPQALAARPALCWHIPQLSPGHLFPKKPFQSLIITQDTTAQAAGLEAAGRTVQKVLCERGNSLMNNRAGRRKSWRLESVFLRRRCFLSTLYLCSLFGFPLFSFNGVSSPSCTSCDFSSSSKVPEGHLIRYPGRCRTVFFFAKLLKWEMVRSDCFHKTPGWRRRGRKKVPGRAQCGQGSRKSSTRGRVGGRESAQTAINSSEGSTETLWESSGINETLSAWRLS